jgi:hypothetical protein
MRGTTDLRAIGTGTSILAAIAGALALVLMAACSSATEPPTSAAAPCADVPIEPLKELLIVDPAVVEDGRSSNEKDGPWSFRRRVEELAPDGGDTDKFLDDWFMSWLSAGRAGVFTALPRPRVGYAMCPWLRATPANQCDDNCSKCAERHYDLARAPFRLIGIANRLDLVTKPVVQGAGEARLLYGFTDGAGDDPASLPLQMSMIFEYRQVQVGASLREVAEKWHHLATHAAFDEDFRQELDREILSKVVMRGADPSAPRQSALNQVRLNERVFDWEWNFREYVITDNGFVLNSLDNTPDQSLNGSDALAQFVLANRAQIANSTHVLPRSMRAASTGRFSWTLPGIDSAQVDAFSKETCNGCHANRPQDFNFMVSPYGRGSERIAASLFDPVNRQDLMAKRETLVRKVLCGLQP